MAGVVSLRARQAPGVSVLVGRYLDYRVGQHTLSPLSARNHRSILNVFAQCVGHIAIDAIQVSHIEAWLASRQHLAPATRRAQFSSVKTFCGWLVREGHLEANPVLELRSPRQPRSVPRAVDADAVAALLSVVPDTRGRAIVWLMVGMGLRCCEVEHLEMGQWDRRTQTMVVRGKGSHERALPVPAEVASALDAYLADYPANSGPLIRSFRRPSSALTADALSGLVSEWFRAAHLKRAARDGISAHALRATAASDVLDVCGDLRVVQEMLGHQNLATTSIYLRRAGLPQLRQAMGGRRYVQPTPDDAA